MQSLSPFGYTARLFATMTGVLMVVWLYVLWAPLAFLPSGYPAWLSKLTMLQDCRPAAIDFFGDSRVEAGIIPRLLPVLANNLGVAGGTPVEVESGVRRALRCAAKPDLVVIALGEDRFGPLGRTFWIESLGYGFLSFADLWGIEHSARSLNDSETLGDAEMSDGLSGPIRDWLYAIRFPSLSFSSLARGQIFRRYADNAQLLRRIDLADGFVPYPPMPPTDLTGPEAQLTKFTATKLQIAYFERSLAALHDSGVPVALLLMPIKQVTKEAMAPSVQAAYINYLRSVSIRFPNVRLVGNDVPAWPSTMFTDNVHLTPAAAEQFTARLASCIDGKAIRTNCDLTWDARVSIARGPEL